MNKYLALLFFLMFLSLQSWGVSVYKLEAKKQFGLIHYSVIVSKQEMKIVKNTNYFDRESHFKAGIAIVKNRDDLEPLLKRLSKYARSTKSALSRLGFDASEKKEGSPHTEYLVLEGQQIERGSVFYKKSMNDFKQILEIVKLSIQKGISSKGEEFEYIEELKKRKVLAHDLVCNGEKKSHLCLSREYGFIFR